MTAYPIKTPKKLIEVALPLDAINVASAREKSIRHGHPSTLHLWWARRPLAAARAVIFAQMVNDPGYQQGGGFKYGMNKEKAALERERLFNIIEDLVQWENTNNEDVLERARAEIWRSWRETCELNKSHPQAADLFNPERLPGFHDPFAGGGALPLEAQRLGLESYASDLNPVAVTINKAMIEIPPRFSGRRPVGPEGAVEKGSKKAATKDAFEDWSGARGLAEDVRRYGAWMREQAEKSIGYLYPQIEVTAEMAEVRPDLKHLIGKRLTVTAWLWARTVKSPNPAFSHVDVPLASSFVLSAKAGKEAYVNPMVEGDKYSFTVSADRIPEAAKSGTKAAGKGAGFYCVLSQSPISGQYIKLQAQQAGLGRKLMAIIAESDSGRVYLSPTEEHEVLANSVHATWKPTQELVGKARDQMPLYGMHSFGDLFTQRQLVEMMTFSDLVSEVVAKVKADAIVAGVSDDGVPLDSGGFGAIAYAQAVGVYLSFSVSRMADRHSSLCRWDPNPSGYAPKIANTFGRQALPMVWDFVEGNPFSPSSGNFEDAVGWIGKVIDFSLSAFSFGSAKQADAQSQIISDRKLISTDPPYYDNINYADLSDFFYVWLRRSLKAIYPDLFATMAVPKAEELVATPYRHGSKEKAEIFFLDGMTRAMHNLAERAHPAFPVTIYYAS